MIECVPNFSEGRSPERVAKLEAAIAGVPEILVLHRTSDVDHNRSVITFAGPGHSVAQAALRAAEQAKDLIDLNVHRGVHPRLGALDVLPFVPLADTTLAECVDVAHAVGERIWRELSVPIYFYEAAALRPERRKLEDVRRGEFEGLRQEVLVDETRQPDLGGPALHPTAGAVIVGARPFLVAYNINLRTNDVEFARKIARTIRTSGGGLPAVKALGLALPSRGLVQISMNLTDFAQTGIDVVYRTVEQLARQSGVEVEESELIGLLPREALEQAAARFLKLNFFDTGRVVENRIEQLRPKGGVS